MAAASPETGRTTKPRARPGASSVRRREPEGQRWPPGRGFQSDQYVRMLSLSNVSATTSQEGIDQRSNPRSWLCSRGGPAADQRSRPRRGGLLAPADLPSLDAIRLASAEQLG